MSVKYQAIGLFVCGFLTVATTVAAQSGSRLEVLKRQGDYYWVVETAPDGSRRGGWVSSQVPLDAIDTDALQPIPSSGSVQAAPPATNGSETEPDLSASRPAAVPRSTPVRQRSSAEPIRQSAGAQHPQMREGFWFNAGLGFGSLGCENCVGRRTGLSGGLSLGGTINEKLLLGFGTTGWAKSEDGATLTVGTADARLRFYPSLNSGFFLNAGIGLGTISVSETFSSESETGVGMMLGLGWDLRVSDNVSLTPFWNGAAVAGSNFDANFGQFGLGVTIH
jgi:opacity protein-like surface antigen